MNLIERAKAKAAEVKTRETEIAKCMIHAMIPNPKGDLYVKDIANADGTVDQVFKPKQLIPETENLKDWKFSQKNFIVKFQFLNEDGKPTGEVLTDFIMENRIVNPMTVYDEVFATFVYSTYISKKGTPEEAEEVQLYSITCSTKNREFQLTHNTGNLVIL